MHACMRACVRVYLIDSDELVHCCTWSRIYLVVLPTVLLMGGGDFA